MENSNIRVLVVDDYAPWRRRIRSMLQKQPEFQVIAEASDGFEAVLRAQELQPDLIFLDFGLPRLNGVEVARRIRDGSPKSRILFVSQESSADIVREALSTGACGYLLKSDTGDQLLIAVKTVLLGEKFVSRKLKGLMVR